MAAVTLLYRELLSPAPRRRRAANKSPALRARDAARAVGSGRHDPDLGRAVSVGIWRYTVSGVDGEHRPVYFLDRSAGKRRRGTRLDARALRRRCALPSRAGDAARRRHGRRARSAWPRPRRHVPHERGSLRATRACVARAPTGERERTTDHDDLALVRRRCVFTTHTPVPAGHDCFGLDLAHDVLGAEYVTALRALDLADGDVLNMSTSRCAPHASPMPSRSSTARCRG